MGKFWRFANGAESMVVLPKFIMGDGEMIAPRGIKTYEVQNVLLQIDDPTDVCMYGINRHWNAAIATAEALQLIGGFSDPAEMQRIAPTFKNFLNGGSLHGAYGPRTSMQFQPMLDRLAEDPSTRQAIVTVWDPMHDIMQEGRKDLPCTLSFTFSIRKNKLCMATHMRSNDVWWGWSYDLFQFTQLQCTVANYFDLDPGPYIHYADSLHLYERNVDAALALTEPEDSERPRLQGIEAYSSWRAVQSNALDLFYRNRLSADLTTTEEFMVEAMIHGRKTELA
jgi:thymidylate synthase